MVSKAVLVCLMLVWACGLVMCSAPTESFPVDSEIPSVGQYKTLELVFTASVAPQNPFNTYLLKLEVTDPRGRIFQIDGFYDGNGEGGQAGFIWKARLCPYETGRWSWRTISGDQADPALANLSGEFRCLGSPDRGGVVAQGAHCRLQSGDPLFLVGNFLDFGNGLTSTHTFMSEVTTDSERDDILERHRDFHAANKANVYFANRGDYSSRSVTPWLGTASSNDKTRMDLARWHLYDGYILALKDQKMIASMWFFADDSGFGDLPSADRNRLFRYAMARTSAFTHTMYVLTLEYQEGWTEAEVSSAGSYLQTKNPWDRTVSVHMLEQTDWHFTGETWPDFIASQGGNNSDPSEINDYAVSMRNDEMLPHIDEEFGKLQGNSDTRLRANQWANLCGGAAGSGTGSELGALQRFLAQSRIPFQRMASANSLVELGGSSRFCLAESGAHYLVYSTTGSFRLTVSGSGLTGRWFNPRDSQGNLGAPFPVSSGSRVYTPPSQVTADWVLWITNSQNLTNGVTHPSGVARFVQVLVNVD